MQNKPLQVRYVAPAEIIPDPKNPRKHSPKQIRQLVKSLEEFDFIVPILIDKQYKLIAGHGRLEAAIKARIQEVPVIMLEHLSDVQARAFMIADNKLTENAEWDQELLAESFKALSSLDIDFSLDITGFEMPEINMMLEVSNESDEDDNIPETPLESSVTEPGDLWLLGEHKILCASSLETGSFTQLMEEKKASLIFIDPPYNVKIKGHVSGLGKIQHREFAMASGEMSPAEFTTFLQQSFRLLAANSEDGSIHYLCMDWRHMRELLDASRDVYGELKNLCVWAKDVAGMGNFYRSQHELIFLFKKGNAPHKNNFHLGQYGRSRSNIWRYPSANSFARETMEGNLLEMHPTPKPVALVADAIRDCSDPGDVVLDSFLGSGSTLIAAERTNRICYGIEIDPHYVDTAIRRWQNLTGKDAVNAKYGITFNKLEGEENSDE